MLKYSKRRIIENKFIQKGLNYKIVMGASNFILVATYVELGIGITFVALGFELNKYLLEKRYHIYRLNTSLNPIILHL